MKLSEEFLTLQGEGRFLGVPSYFIRTTGCNLRCAWKNPDDSVTVCDTPYTSFKPEKGYDLDMGSVLEKLTKSNAEHIVITGGEPMLQKDLGDVVEEFNGMGYKTTIETNGTIYRDDIKGAFLSISPKLISSYAQAEEVHKRLHTQNNHFKENIKNYIQNYEHQIKFVVNDEQDLNEIYKVQKECGIENKNILLMPQGITVKQLKDKSKWLFDECIKYGYTYAPRMHIDIFGDKRGI